MPRPSPASSLSLLLALLASSALHAATPSALQGLAEDFLRAHTSGLPGKVTISVAPLRDQQRHLADCRTPEAFLPQGQRAWGRVTVGVRCRDAGRHLAVHLSARVTVTGRYLALARNLNGGQQLVEADLQWTEGELTRHPPDLLTEPAQAIGRSTRQALSRAQALRASYLMSTVHTRAGQPVTLVARGAGFSVQNNGHALNAAALGELVRVKLANGRIISGVLRENGTVAVDD